MKTLAKKGFGVSLEAKVVLLLLKLATQDLTFAFNVLLMQISCFNKHTQFNP